MRWCSDAPIFSISSPSSGRSSKEGIALVDSRDGVARQVARLLDDSPASDSVGEPDTLYVTGALPLEERYRWFAGQFGLTLQAGP